MMDKEVNKHLVAIRKILQEKKIVRFGTPHRGYYYSFDFRKIVKKRGN